MSTTINQIELAFTDDDLTTLPLREDRPWMHGVAGLLSGSVAMMLFYPLDLLRTRMHILNQRSDIKVPSHSIRLILSHEGLRGMYRGMSVSVLAHGLGWGTYLVTFRVTRARMEGLLGRFSWVGTFVKDFLSACVAAVITSVFITPFYVMKTCYQLQDSTRTGSAALKAPTRGPSHGWQFVRYLLRPEGRRAMFRGFGPQTLLTSSTTIQVTLYEWFRRHYVADSRDPSIMEVALSSAVAKAITCGVFNPLEVVRTRLQYVHNQQRPDYRNMRLGLQTIWRHEGISGMYRGILTNMARVIPTTVVSFILYERLLRAIRSSRKPSFSGQRLWGRAYEFMKKNEDYYIGYDELIPDYTNYFNESI